MKKIYQATLLSFLFLLFISFKTAAFTVTVVTTASSCFSGNDGSAVVTVSGGTAPYQYSLDNVIWQSSNVLTGLSPATYTVFVTDASSDFGTAMFTVADGPYLSGTVTSTPTACLYGPGATITATATSGTGPYTYYFNGETVTGSQATFTHDIYSGSYVVAFIDMNGCLGSLDVDVVNGDSLRATAIVQPPSCSTSDDGLVQFQFNNGFPPYTLVESSWGWINAAYSDAGTNSWTGDFAAGNYVWHMQDSAGCEGILNMIVPVGLPASTHAGNDTAICLGASVQLSGTDNGTMMMWGTTYFWTPAAGLSQDSISNPIATPLTTTSYILTSEINTSLPATYCISSDTIIITVIDLATPTIALNASILSVTNVQTGINYTWQQLDGTNWTDLTPGTSYTVSTNADYRVKAFNGACEQYSAPVSVNLSSPRNAFSIAMYPNPATNVLLLNDLKLSDQWQRLEIINYQGQRAMPGKDIRNQTNVTININSLSAGIYVARLTKADGKTVELKFIKQ